MIFFRIFFYKKSRAQVTIRFALSHEKLQPQPLPSKDERHGPHLFLSTHLPVSCDVGVGAVVGDRGGNADWGLGGGEEEQGAAGFAASAR